MTYPQTIDSAQANKETPLQEDQAAVSFGAVLGYRAEDTSGLVFAYHGGIWSGLSISDGTVTATNSTTNYVVVNRSTGAVTISTGTTNWNDSDNYARMYRLVTSGGVFTNLRGSNWDYRGGDGGAHGSATGVAAASFADVVAESGSSRNITSSDAGDYLRFTGTGAKTADFVGDYTADEEYHIANRAASGDLTLAPDSGITLNAPKGGTLVLEPGDTVTVKFISAYEADVFGSTADA